MTFLLLIFLDNKTESTFEGIRRLPSVRNKTLQYNLTLAEIENLIASRYFLIFSMPSCLKSHMIIPQSAAIN